jgi:hypothetical protein
MAYKECFTPVHRRGNGRTEARVQLNIEGPKKREQTISVVLVYHHTHTNYNQEWSQYT